MASCMKKRRSEMSGTKKDRRVIMMKTFEKQNRFSIGQKAAGIFLSAAMLTTSFTGLGGILSVSDTVNAASSVNYMVDDQQDGSILQCFN